MLFRLDAINGDGYILIPETVPGGIEAITVDRINDYIYYYDAPYDLYRKSINNLGGTEETFYLLDELPLVLDNIRGIAVGEDDFDNYDRIIQLDDIYGTNWNTYGTTGFGIGEFLFFEFSGF